MLAWDLRSSNSLGIIRESILWQDKKVSQIVPLNDNKGKMLVYIHMINSTSVSLYAGENHLSFSLSSLIGLTCVENQMKPFFY